jgi:hypothetical protein
MEILAAVLPRRVVNLLPSVVKETDADPFLSRAAYFSTVQLPLYSTSLCFPVLIRFRVRFGTPDLQWPGFGTISALLFEANWTTHAADANKFNSNKGPFTK